MFCWHGEEVRALAGYLAYNSSFWRVIFAVFYVSHQHRGLNNEVLEAHWLVHLTEVLGSIPTWNSGIFSVVPLPVAKQLSFTSFIHNRIQRNSTFHTFPRFRLRCSQIWKMFFFWWFFVSSVVHYVFVRVCLFFACFLQLFSVRDCVYIYSVYSSHDWFLDKLFPIDYSLVRTCANQCKKSMSCF